MFVLRFAFEAVRPVHILRLVVASVDIHGLGVQP